MGLIISKVNHKNPTIQRVLRLLQKSCLPADDLYDNDQAVWWVVYDGSIPVGFACAAPSKRWSDTIYLARAGITRQYRGKGLQKRLIKLRCTWAKRHGYTWAISDTTDNIPSANNLIACGFKMYNPTWPYGVKETLYWKYALQGLGNPKIKTA